MSSTTTFADDLLSWGEHELRDLPWRRSRDPWEVLVSETMLQQTQVVRVEPRWRAFLATFPTPADCAAASPGEVVRLWDGLGYNRRALNLHRAAVVITEEHAGIVPDTLDALVALPGVGPYTARAIRVFAFECQDAVVDVNVARVLARAVAGRRLTTGEAQRLADEQVEHVGAGGAGQSWLWNQSMIELGATHCRKRSPACGTCPVAAQCAWAGEGPDPAAGSAGTGARQSRFEGSDRQGRGRLLDALRAGDLAADRAGEVTGWDDPQRNAAVVAGLVADGLAVRQGPVLTLPG